VREAHGFSFSMRIVETTQTVRVFVADNALEDNDTLPDEDRLRGQFDAYQKAFEAVARAKYAHGRVAANGVIVIALADTISFNE
jgi:hypothetical protein